jgi:oxaloacetate decarboxylase gamma subunit
MEMFTQSGALAMLGMGVVFGFLIILIVIISMTGQVINILGLDKNAQTEPPVVQSVKTAPICIDGVVVAAITAAVKARRNE